MYVARDWGQDQKKNKLDWWEGYCAKMTWAEAGWATFFGSCPLVHFGKALHWWSHLKKRCLAQLLHEPEPKLKNKPYQRGPKSAHCCADGWAWPVSVSHPGQSRPYRALRKLGAHGSTTQQWVTMATAFCRHEQRAHANNELSETFGVDCATHVELAAGNMWCKKEKRAWDVARLWWGKKVVILHFIEQREARASRNEIDAASNGMQEKKQVYRPGKQIWRWKEFTYRGRRSGEGKQTWRLLHFLPTLAISVFVSCQSLYQTFKI
jgi:hypothetical protein